MQPFAMRVAENSKVKFTLILLQCKNRFVSAKYYLEVTGYWELVLELEISLLNTKSKVVEFSVTKSFCKY